MRGYLSFLDGDFITNCLRDVSPKQFVALQIIRLWQGERIKAEDIDYFFGDPSYSRDSYTCYRVKLLRPLVRKGYLSIEGTLSEPSGARIRALKGPAISHDQKVRGAAYLWYCLRFLNYKEYSVYCAIAARGPISDLKLSELADWTGSYSYTEYRKGAGLDKILKTLQQKEFISFQYSKGQGLDISWVRYRPEDRPVAPEETPLFSISNGKETIPFFSWEVARKCRDLGMDRTSIQRLRNGRMKTYRGYWLVGGDYEGAAFKLQRGDQIVSFYDGSIKATCTEYGLDIRAVRRLRKGEQDRYKGWVLLAQSREV